MEGNQGVRGTRVAGGDKQLKLQFQITTGTEIYNMAILFTMHPPPPYGDKTKIGARDTGNFRHFFVVFLILFKLFLSLSEVFEYSISYHRDF